MPTTLPCRGCTNGVRAPGQYLCRTCWFALPDGARRLLNRRDTRAYARLRQLHAQLDQDVPLAEIRITA